MGKKKKNKKQDLNVEFYNDQLGENAAEGRIEKEMEKKERKRER